MRRGDVVAVATSGDYGKPRPALIIQTDVYAEHPSVTVLPITSELYDLPMLRLTLEPGRDTGLRLRSQVMVDKATTIPRTKAGGHIGRVDDETMVTITRAFAAFVGAT